MHHVAKIWLLRLHEFRCQEQKHAYELIQLAVLILKMPMSSQVHVPIEYADCHEQCVHLVPSVFLHVDQELDGPGSLLLWYACLLRCKIIPNLIHLLQLPHGEVVLVRVLSALGLFIFVLVEIFKIEFIQLFGIQFVPASLHLLRVIYHGLCHFANYGLLRLFSLELRSIVWRIPWASLLWLAGYSTLAGHCFELFGSLDLLAVRALMDGTLNTHS